MMVRWMLSGLAVAAWSADDVAGPHGAPGMLSPLVGTTTAVAISPEVDPALLAIARTLAEASVWHGTFTLHHIPAGEALADPERRRVGEFALAGGGRYHLRQSAPDGFEAVRWCSDGESTWVMERAAPDDAAVVRNAQGPDLVFAQRIAAALRLDVVTLSRTYRLQPVGSATPVSGALLTARDAQEDPQSVEVSFVNGRPREVVLLLNAGERLRLVVDTLERLDTPDPRWFKP